MSTAGLVGVKFLSSVLLLAGGKETVLLINGHLEVSNSSDLLLSVLGEDNFLIFSKDLPVGESSRSGDLIVHHSLHGLFKMSNELIEHIEDLLLESGISGSLSGVKVSHLHLIHFVINVVISNV